MKCDWCEEPLERLRTKYCDACVALMPRAKVTPAEFAQRFPWLTLTAAEDALWQRECRQRYEPARLARKTARLEQKGVQP